MKNPRRALLLLPLAAAGLLALAPGSRAQAQSSPRFAFADTTLLRDTLGLRFDRLFETADSLSILPDSLRAQIIRYRLPMARLVFMADSMGVPVDSVGVVIARERFNPFTQSVTAGSRTTFKYTSGYSIGKTVTDWTNGGDYSFTRGKLLLRNGTTITMTRATAAGKLNLRQDRNSTSEANWRLTPNFSLGGRAFVYSFDDVYRGSTVNQRETKSELQLSTRTRQQYSKDLTSELNLFTGYLNSKNLSQLKRGLTGDLNGRTRYLRGSWLTHELSGAVNGNLSRTQRTISGVDVATRDLSTNLRGALQLYQASPVGLNVNYSVRRTAVETPTEIETVNRLLTSGANADATMRLRKDNDRFLTLTARASRNATLTGTRVDKEGRAQGRWVLGPWALDAQAANVVGDSRYPRRSGAYGYTEKQDNRQASGEITRPFGRKITTKLTSSISLVQSRSRAIADSASPPTPRDSYRQSYRAEARYNQSERLTSGVALEVGLSRSINLPAASTSNNTDTRSYRAEWRWNYRLLRGLTASQTNTLQADYQFYPFASERNDLSLDYYVITNLNAVITPRLSVDVSHNARQQPSGDWRVLPDGSGVLLPADENLNYTLRSSVTYSPSPAMSFTLTPEYVATDRNGTTNGVEAPTRKSRRLNFTGGANLNLQIGRRGQVTGTVRRTFSSESATNYRNGVPQVSPVSEQDYWNGQLQFSWEL